MSETRSVIVERDFPYPPGKIWRALTEPHLIEAWLMKSDFKPDVSHRFQFRGDWGAADCEVRTVELNRSLSYSWSAMGLESLVIWTLTATASGTHLRMEQRGFREDQNRAFHGARAGWQQFFAKLEQVLAGLYA